MSRILATLVGLLSLTFVSATCEAPPLKPTPQQVLDGGVVASCANACDRMAAFNCVESRPTDKGMTCVAVCETTPAYAALPLACIVSATSLGELQAKCSVCR